MANKFMVLVDSKIFNDYGYRPVTRTFNFDLEENEFAQSMGLLVLINNEWIPLLTFPFSLDENFYIRTLYVGD